MRLQQQKSVCVTGKFEGRRGRDRPRVKFVDRMAKSVGVGITPAHLLQRTERRYDWGSNVANVLKDTPLW